jgi:hypothetical protein
VQAKGQATHLRRTTCCNLHNQPAKPKANKPKKTTYPSTPKKMLCTRGFSQLQTEKKERQLKTAISSFLGTASSLRRFLPSAPTRRSSPASTLPQDTI